MVAQSEKGVVKMGLAPLQRDRFSTGKKDFRCNGACPTFTRNSVGFLLGDKKAGPFKLVVDWIKVSRQNQ